MQYKLLLYPHQNIRYRASLNKITKESLRLSLLMFGRETYISDEQLGAGYFLNFETPQLSEKELRYLSQLAGVYMAFIEENGALYPIDKKPCNYVPEDIAALLKYKGKTNEMFTDAMVNIALALSNFGNAFDQPLTVCDPLAGKGTSLMLALMHGYNSLGIEISAKDIQETVGYLKRYFEYHRIKYKYSKNSLTVHEHQGGIEHKWNIANTNVEYKNGEFRSLKLICGDTRNASIFLGKESAHIMVADLPYGVQTGTAGKNISIIQTIREALPGWKTVLKTGGTLCISFNTYVTARADLIELGLRSGFQHLETKDLVHWVEQAINRDVLVFKKECVN